MKILSFVARMASMLLAVILFSCGENPTALKGPSEEQVFDTQGKKGGPKIAADIVVSPSGDASGVTDANSIEAALNSLPDGGTVLLEQGTFYVNRELFIPDFNGTLTGNGKDATEIVGVGDAVTPFEFGIMFLFVEPSGFLTMSNFSISLPSGFETTVGNMNSFVLVLLTSEGTDTHFDNLALNGTDAVPSLPPIFGSQPNNSIVVQGDFSAFPSFSSGGVHQVTNCDFDQAGFQGTIHQGFDNAQIIVDNNTYSNLKQTLYRFMHGSSISITNNDMETFSFGAIVVTQEGVPVPGDDNSVHIRGNTIVTSGFMPVEVGWIPDGGASYSLLIEKNKLINTGSDPIGIFPAVTGIGVGIGNNGAIVRNNIIGGEAFFAIRNEGNGSLFQGNNTNGMDPIAAHYGLFGDNNTVVGRGNSTVIDFGVDNIITGLKKVEGESISDRIKAALETRKAILDEVASYQN